MSNKTAQTVFAMMMTSTGKAICDSGDAYGRHWQRNQARYKTLADIEKEPAVSFEKPRQWYTLKDGAGQFVRRDTTRRALETYIAGDNRPYTIEKEKLDSSDIDYTVNLFHHLVNSLTIDETCEAFNALPCDDWDSEEAYGVSIAQVEWLREHGLKIGSSWNSYNGENNLSQVVQGANVYGDNDSGDVSSDEWPTYILLQIHQGCDVRGGYTDAKLFRIDNDSNYFTTNPDVYGSIDGVEVDTRNNGYSLTNDNGNVVPVKPSSTIELYTL